MEKKTEPTKGTDDFEIAELDDHGLEDTSGGGVMNMNCGCLED
jgi:hypothetical protein